ncbi:MAG: alpha/beta hydrolase, partial [Cyanobacteria bacterium J06641_5]
LFRYLLGQQTPEAYRYLAAEAVPAYVQTSRAATRALNRALKAGYDRREALAQIQVPALVLAGERDRHISAASSQETAECLPQATWHCYSEAAHLFPWEIPNRVCTDIDAWLQAHPQVCS